MSLSGGLDLSAEPKAASAPERALWWLAKGRFKLGEDWEKAHAICQMAEGEPAHDLVHALAHLIEGDMANANYWYRRAGVPRTSSDPATEWQAIVRHLGF